MSRPCVCNLMCCKMPGAAGRAGKEQVRGQEPGKSEGTTRMSKLARQGGITCRGGLDAGQARAQQSRSDRRALAEWAAGQAHWRIKEEV